MNSRKWTVWAWLALGGAFALLMAANFLWGSHWLDSDMAAEMIFSKLLWDEGAWISHKAWYYSTEFRILYTQLLMRPLFGLFSDWGMVRLCANGLSYLLLLAAYGYSMRPLALPSHVKILSAIPLLLPFSETSALHMQMGNTYIFHIMLQFLALGLFWQLEQGKSALWAAPAQSLLALILGMSGIRYLLSFYLPLVAAALAMAYISGAFQSFRIEGRLDGGFWRSREAGRILWSLEALACCVAGYGINALWISKEYSFVTYEGVRWIDIYQGNLWPRLQDALGSIFMLFGYIPGAAVLSLRGMVSSLALVLVVLLGLLWLALRKALVHRQKWVQEADWGREGFLLALAMAAFAMEAFVLVFTQGTIVPRYFLPSAALALPLAAALWPLAAKKGERNLLYGLAALCLLLATAKTYYSLAMVDKNEGKKAVAAFLEAGGWEFGYASYWNGNILTELADQRLEVANVQPGPGLGGDWEYFLWSSPHKYYDQAYGGGGEVFLALTREEFGKYKDMDSLARGKVVFESEEYVVLVYATREALLGSG